MAPEVISQKQYDSSADIWSLGITALELAQGRAPYSRDPPGRVLAKILNNEPPALDRTGGGKHKYSRAFADVVAMCLCKDPTARPTAEQLLALPFFRGARHRRHLVGALLSGLPPLADRQERRRQASIASNPSASSWDFSATHTTHTMSIFRRSSVSVHRASPSPTPGRSRSHASAGEREGRAGMHFRTSSLRIRSLSIGDEYEAPEDYEGAEEGGHALVFKGRRDRERQRTRGREEAVTPLLVSPAYTAQQHPRVLPPDPDSLGLDATTSDDDEAANKRHLSVRMINSKSDSISGSGSGSGTGSGAGSILAPSPLAPLSNVSLSSMSSPEDLATPPAGMALSSGTIKVWRKLRGRDKARKGSTSSVGTSRLSGFFGTVLERKMSRK